MGRKTIPEHHVWNCDVCKITKTDHDSEYRPKGWMQMNLYQSAHDYQGNAVAANNTELVICDVCTPLIRQAVEDVREVRKEALHLDV